MNSVSLSFYLPEPSSLLYKIQLKDKEKSVSWYLLEISNDILDLLGFQVLEIVARINLILFLIL